MTDAGLAKSIVRAARSASLGTIESDGGPFVSLVTVAATSGSDPESVPTVLMLLSGLARHTQNLNANASASLLLAEAPSGTTGEPLAAARVTLVGTVKKLESGSDAEARAVFLDAHPSAELYAGFGDFAIYEFSITTAHLVAGFGRIETVSADQL